MSLDLEEFSVHLNSSGTPPIFKWLIVNKKKEKLGGIHFSRRFFPPQIIDHYAIESSSQQLFKWSVIFQAKRRKTPNYFDCFPLVVCAIIVWISIHWKWVTEMRYALKHPLKGLTGFMFCRLGIAISIDPCTYIFFVGTKPSCPSAGSIFSPEKTM